MATRTKKRSSSGKSASQKSDKYRFAQNVDGDETAAEYEYRSYAEAERTEEADTPDVLLDVPVIKVDSIHLEVEDLAAQVSLQAKVLELLNLDVGVEIQLDRLKLDLKGVEAQALLKVRLDHVAAIVDRLMTTLDRNPDLVESIGKAVEDVGSGSGHTLSEAGEAEEHVGEGTEDALEQVGEGAGDAVGEVGQGAGEGVGELGEGAGQAAGEAGEGAGEAAGNLGEAAGQATGAVGDVAGQEGSGQGDDGGDSGGGLEVGELTDDAGVPTGGKLAKAAAKTVAKEIGSAASDEAKELGMAATRKVKELGDRRRQKRAERHHATAAAMELAGDLGVDLDEVEGSGAEGRIVVADVRDAAEEE
ncbi:MAG TPA: E3 binding domain-containing protein [Solirubrobacterales bacterium]|nr:E3 binding domain-containing protein [Solirubrobacterales bacterium]